MIEARKARPTNVVADTLGVTTRTVRRWYESGTLHGYRRGKLIFIFVESVAKMQVNEDLRTLADTRN